MAMACRFPSSILYYIFLRIIKESPHGFSNCADIFRECSPRNRILLTAIHTVSHVEVDLLARKSCEEWIGEI